MHKRSRWKEQVARWVRRLGVQRPLRTAREHISTITQFARPAPPLHRSEGFAPFFIVGPGRCGSTLLRRVLQASPDVHIPPENWQFKQTVLRFQRYRRLLDWEDLAQLVLWPLVRNSEYDSAFFDRLRPLHGEVRDLSSSERSLARLIDMLYRAHGMWAGAEFERWGDKTPINVGWMDEIVAVFPDARFVFMQRDGVDVVHSHIDALGNSVRKAARTWKQSVQFLDEFRQNYSNPCRVIRYEELVAYPERETRRLCKFLNVSFSPSMVTADEGSEPSDLQRIDHHQRALGPITEDRVGVGHQALSVDEKQMLHELIGTELREWGYSISV